MGRHATFTRQICTGQSATVDAPACGNRAFKSRNKRTKSGLKEQEEKCPRADFLHEVELLSKHNTKVAAATTRNCQISGWNDSCASRSPG
jgi:hypothetical protein